MAVLYLVATPIGNLSDFSQRAVETLRSADKIGCEDTRISTRLLQHYQIEKPLFPFHLHNEHKKVQHLVNLLNSGLNIALISNAGMPGISDPGFLATRAAHLNGHTVRVIPGADACTTALVSSGLPCERYRFEGFLPPKKGRQTRIREIAEQNITTVIYESPHRLLKILGELVEHAGGERLACIARELTKKYEQVQRAPLLELQHYWQKQDTIKGEFVIVLAGITYSE